MPMQTHGAPPVLAVVGRASAPPGPAPSNADGNGLDDGQGPAAGGEAAAPGADWQARLGSVATRLADIGSAASAANLQTAGALMECVEALGQLHAALVADDDRRHRLERELRDARMALAGLRDGERRARHEALHDALTSLPNRQHFRDRLQQALATPSGPNVSLAVLYIDLDDFKPVNDQHGHATGDELLRIVATRLMRAVRAEDMASRLGGDEFACLIADMPDPAGLEALARKLIAVVSAPVTLGALELQVQPSIGIAVSPLDASSADGLLRRADAAMYRAKRTKTGVARFDLLIDDPNRVSAPSEPP